MREEGGDLPSRKRVGSVRSRDGRGMEGARSARIARNEAGVGGSYTSYGGKAGARNCQDCGGSRKYSREGPPVPPRGEARGVNLVDDKGRVWIALWRCWRQGVRTMLLRRS